MRLSDINKKIILSVAFVIIVNTFAVGALMFINIKVRGMNDKIVVTRGEMKLKEKDGTDAKYLKTNLLSLSEGKEKFDDVFIGKKGVLSFIEEIETLAKESGVEMEFRSVDISQSDNGEKPVFQFKASGSFPDVFHYLVLLENIKYQIVFDNISLQENGVSGSIDNTRVMWDANFSLRLLSYN